eukprot:scaffold4.g4971.t1
MPRLTAAACYLLALVASVAAICQGLAPGAGRTSAWSRRRLAEELQQATRTLGGEGSAADALLCAESGMCSIGKLGPPYIGEVDSTEGLKKVLAAAAFKQEVIIASHGNMAPNLAMNLVFSIWEQGLANVLVLGLDEPSCQPIIRVYKNVRGSLAGLLRVERGRLVSRRGEHCQTPAAIATPCLAAASLLLSRVAITTTPASAALQIEPGGAMWIRRYLLTARAVRMGYGVFVLDTDAGLLAEPYKYLNSPLFREVQFLSMQDGAGIINGGANYVHAAAPDGPAAWALWNTGDRMLRLLETWHDYWVKERKIPGGVLTSAVTDQVVLNDVFASIKLGWPVTKYSLRLGLTADQLKRQDDLASWYNQHNVPRREWKYPVSWHWLTGGGMGHTQSCSLRIPYLGGKWDEAAWGKRVPPRRNYSLAFMKRIAEESGAPMWGDYETDPPPASQPKNETWAFFPDWFISFYNMRGGGGKWDVDPPQQVMFHIVALGGDAPPQHKKEYAMRAHGRWRYHVSAVLMNGTLFPSSTPEQPLPRVLSLAPGLRVVTGTENEFRDLMRELVHLATLLDRVLHIPEPYCNSEWVRAELGSGPRPTLPVVSVVVYLGAVQPDLAPGSAGEEATFTRFNATCRWPATDKNCMPGALIVLPDFQELLRRLPPDHSRATAKNTMWHELLEPALAAGGSWNYSKPNGALQVVLSGAAALEAGKKLEGKHVVYMGALPRLSTPLPPGDSAQEAAFQRFNSGCRWLGISFKPDPP